MPHVRTWHFIGTLVQGFVSEPFCARVTTYLKKPHAYEGKGNTTLTPNDAATQQSVDCESLTPTRGATQQSVDCESLTPTQRATQQSVGKRNKKERKNTVPRSPLKECGAALGPGFCSKCSIFNKRHLYSNLSC